MSALDENLVIQNIEPTALVHEYSSTEFYYGTSVNGSNTSKPTWQIKKVVKVGNVWSLNQYPDGNQTFEYIWDDRLTYTYK